MTPSIPSVRSTSSVNVPNDSRSSASESDPDKNLVKQELPVRPSRSLLNPKSIPPNLQTARNELRAQTANDAPLLDKDKGVPVKHVTVENQNQRDAAIREFGGNVETTFTPKKLVGRTRRNAIGFFEKQCRNLPLADPKDFSKVLASELKKTGRLYAPFWGPKVISSTQLEFVAKALHTVACDPEVKCGVIDFAFGEDPTNIYLGNDEESMKSMYWHDWENLKTFLPECLGDLGKQSLDMNDQRPSSWQSKNDLMINVDLSCVGLGLYSEKEASHEFIGLLSKLATSNLNKLKLNGEAFYRQEYWDALSDMTCTAHEGSKLDELELQRRDTYETSEDFPSPNYDRSVYSAVSMAEEALAKAIESKDFKPKIVRLTGFYFPETKSPVLEDALKKREENGLSKIEIFGGHRGDVPLDKLTTRGLFPASGYR